MKKIILLSFSVLSIFLIFLITKKTIINYVSLNEYEYKDFYNYNDYLENYFLKNRLLHENSNYYSNTINELKESIKSNRILKKGNGEYYIKKELRESHLVVIAAGMQELSYYYDHSNIGNYSKIVENIVYDLETFFKEITKYAKKDILYIGLYNSKLEYSSDIDEFFWILDNEINKKCNKYNIKYLSIYELVKQNNCINNDTSMLKTNCHILIAKRIISYIENNL